MYENKNKLIGIIDESCLDLFHEQLFILKDNPNLKAEMEKQISPFSVKVLNHLLGGCFDDE